MAKEVGPVRGGDEEKRKLDRNHGKSVTDAQLLMRVSTARAIQEQFPVNKEEGQRERSTLGAPTPSPIIIAETLDR
jgi:hypothetical protein